MGPDTAFTLQNMPSKKSRLYIPFCYGTRQSLLCRKFPLKIKIYMYPFVMRKTLHLLCRICPLKIKIYIYPFVMRPKTAFTLQNMPSQNQDPYVPFSYETQN